MDLVEDTRKILYSSQTFNAEDYNNFLTAIKENPGLRKLVREYSALMQQSELTDSDADRILEIIALAEYDNLLNQCISKVDESLEILDEVKPSKLSIIDFISKVKAIPKRNMTEELFFKLVQQIDIKLSCLSNHIEFKEKHNRQVILSTPELCISLICWKAGQETSIHRHEYNFGNVLVCQGILTSTECEETYTFGRKSFKTISYKHYHQGQWLSIGHNTLHQLGNYADNNLMTLHFKYFLTDPLDRNSNSTYCTKRDSNPRLLIA